MVLKEFALLSLLLLCSRVYSGNIKGVVRDASTGDLLIGATVMIVENEKGMFTGFDGSFVFRNLQAGKYQIICSYVSYQTQTVSTQVPANGDAQVEINLSSVSKDISEVVVYGNSDLSTDKSARASERNAMNVINIVSANMIELSPDLNVASVVQRMSGVTMEKNSSGEPQYAILRGMDKRYNYTLVNGIKIPSPDNKHRFVPLDIFPGELLDRLEVTKSLTADMEGDASGGVINMIMKDAPTGMSLQANAAMGYNSRFIKNDFIGFNTDKIIMKSPREVNGKTYAATMADFNNQNGALISQSFSPNYTAGLSIGNRFLNRKLGVLFATNIQNNYRGANSTYFDDQMIQTDKYIRVTEQNDRIYFENQKQYGFHIKMDYQFNARNKIEMYNAYIDMQNFQVRQNTATSFKLNYDPSVGNYDLSYQTRFRSIFQQVYTSTLQGKHLLWADINAQWSLVYSIAKNRMPEQTHINIDNLVQNNVDNIYADADGSTRRWEHNSDRDYAGYLNFSKKFLISDIPLNIKSGALYRNKSRTNSYVNYRFKPVNGDQRYGLHYETLDEISWTLFTPSGSVGPLEYDAHENIFSTYIMASIEYENLFFNAGIRDEFTDQGYYMHFPNAGESPDGSQVYSDILPSAQFKYSPNKKSNIRLTYFKSVNRPGFFEIVPYQIINEDYDEFGNKNLKRAKIDNLDMRFEYFPKPTEQLMAGIFYKKLKDPIEFAFYTVNSRQWGYMPINFGVANNLGFEIDFIKYIRNVGFKINYTYTYSAITTSKIQYSYDETNTLRRNSLDQIRPLANQANHVANATLMCRIPRIGFDGQISSSYTGEKITIVSQYYDSDYWQKPAWIFDASAEQKLKSGLSIFIKVNNILNAPQVLFVKTHNTYNDKFPMQNPQSNETLIREDFYGRVYLVGLRYKFIPKSNI